MEFSGISGTMLTKSSTNGNTSPATQSVTVAGSAMVIAVQGSFISNTTFAGTSGLTLASQGTIASGYSHAAGYLNATVGGTYTTGFTWSNGGGVQANPIIVAAYATAGATSTLNVQNLAVTGTCTGCGANLPSTPGIVYNTSSTTSRNATGTDVNALLQAQAACSVSGNVYSPYSGSCIPISQTLSVSGFGAKFDGQRANDCATTFASTTLTCASNHFVAGDVGKKIAVQFAGPVGALNFGTTLLTTIAAYVSPTQITLATAPSATIPGPRTIHLYWSANSTTISETDNDLVNGDMGKKFELPEGGLPANQATLIAPKEELVSKVPAANSMTVPFATLYAAGSATTPLAATLPGATIAWGTDDCVAWTKAVQAANAQGKRLWMDPGVSLTGCPITMMHNVIVEGQGAGISVLAPIGGKEFASTGGAGAFNWSGGLYIYPTGFGARIINSVTTGPLGQCSVDWAQSPDGINPPGTGYATGDHLLPNEPGATTGSGVYCVVGDVNASGAPLNYNGSTGGGSGFYSAPNLDVTAKTGTGTGAKVILQVGPLDHAALDNFEIDMSATGSTDNTIFPKANFMRPMLYGRVFQMYAHDCQATCLGNDYFKMGVYKDNLVDWGGKYASMWASLPAGSAGIGIGTGLWPREEQVITNNLVRYSGSRAIFVESQGRTASTGISIINNVVTWGTSEGIGDHGNYGTLISNNNVSGFSTCGSMSPGLGGINSDAGILSNNTCSYSNGWQLVTGGGAGITVTGNRMDGSPSGATLSAGTGLDITTGGNPVVSATVNTAGSGCVTGDLLMLYQASVYAGFVAVVTGNATPAGVSTFTILSGGSGYTTATGLSAFSSSATCTGVKLNITTGPTGPLKITDNVFTNISQRSIYIHPGSGGTIGLVEISRNQFLDSGWSLSRPAIDIASGITISSLAADSNIVAAQRVAANASYGLAVETGATVTRLWTGTNNDFSGAITGTILTAGTVTNWVGPEMQQSGTAVLAGGTVTVTLAPMYASTSSFRCSAIDTTTKAVAGCTIASPTSITITGTTTDAVQWVTSGR